MMALPGGWHTIPPIAGIIEAPTILADNTLVVAPGYVPKTWLYYAPGPGVTIPRIPEATQPDEVKEAVEILKEVIGDFPFVD
ncbi:MAG: hypothetical protein LUP97_02650, partial [Methanoregula sp.]|nr:hypothetical protein [Methanoregula sp.]